MLKSSREEADFKLDFHETSEHAFWMFRRTTALIAALALLPAWTNVRASGLPLTRQELKALSVESMNDGIPPGWCGRAMLSLLKKSGLGEGLKPGNGQDWEQILAAAGWKPVRVSSPLRAPLGSVLVYLSDRRLGKIPRGTRGGYYGHVEMVSLSPTGGRLYVSDSARPKPGGTVPDNFTGRAWVPPRSLLAASVPVEDQVSAVLAARLSMALRHFERRQRDLAQLREGPEIVTTPEG